MSSLLKLLKKKTTSEPVDLLIFNVLVLRALLGLKEVLLMQWLFSQSQIHLFVANREWKAESGCEGDYSLFLLAG